MSIHTRSRIFCPVLANVPFRPTSPWQMFAAEKLKGAKNEKMGQRMADISAEWKSMSEQDKKVEKGAITISLSLHIDFLFPPA